MIVTFGTKRPAPRRRDPVGLRNALLELDSRHVGGLTVRLLWDRLSDQVIIHVRDDSDRIDFVLNPPNSKARYAFEHPFGVAHLFSSNPGGADRPLAA